MSRADHGLPAPWSSRSERETARLQPVDLTRGRLECRRWHNLQAKSFFRLACTAALGGGGGAWGRRGGSRRAGAFCLPETSAKPLASRGDASVSAPCSPEDSSAPSLLAPRSAPSASWAPPSTTWSTVPSIVPIPSPRGLAQAAGQADALTAGTGSAPVSPFGRDGALLTGHGCWARSSPRHPFGRIVTASWQLQWTGGGQRGTLATARSQLIYMRGQHA